jgi:hypothetical protein
MAEMPTEGVSPPKSTRAGGRASAQKAEDVALANDAETHDTDENQVGGDNEIQEARHDKNENAGDQRDDRLKMRNADDHGSFLW